MTNIRRLLAITLIIISTVFMPSVFGDADHFDLTVYEANMPTNTVTGSGILSTNAVSNIKIEWTVADADPYAYFEVFLNGVKQNGSRLTSNSWTLTAAGLPAEGSYPIRVDAYADAAGGSVGHSSVVTTLRVDTTAPAAVTNLAVLDPNDSDNDITDQEENVGEVKLTWTAPADSDLQAQPYKVYYVLPNRTPVEITDISNITGTVANSIDISPNGLAIFDTEITFQVTATDTAFNESVVAEAAFTLDTKTADNIRNLTMKDSAVVIGNGGVRNNITRIEWDAPTSEDADFYQVYYKIDDGAFIATGSPIAAGTEYYDLGVLASGGVFDTDSQFTFKVTSLDNAGNESSGASTSFYLDTVDPVAVITYTDSDTQNSTSIVSASVNFVEKQTIEVVNTANDIAKYSVTTSASPNYVNGDRDDLQDLLRNLSVDGDYTITIMDEAGNTAAYDFTLSQQFPALPTNKSLTVSSLDLEDRIGVQSNVTVTWYKSTDSNLDHYEVYVNGEMIANDITNSGVTGSTITYEFTLDTIKYGDVENYYEVRTYDADGNYGTYTIRKHVTEDLVKPTAEILFTESNVEEIKFTVKLTDFNRVVDEVYAALYKGAQYVKSIQISTGTNTYTFDNLDDGEDNYKIKIEADFVYDSVTYNNEVINPDTVYNIDTLTNSNDVVASIGTLDITESSVDFELTTTKDSTSNESVDVKIYQGLTLIDTVSVSLDTDDLTTVRPISFSSLAIGEDFQIRVVDGLDVLATANFFTQKDVPTVEFRISEIEGNAISMRIVLKDDDGAINLGTDERVVRVYYDGVAIQEIDDLAIGTNNITFTQLDFNTEYEFRVFSSYNLENGRGRIINDMIGETSFMTAKETPTVEILNLEVTDSNVVFDIDIEDDYGANVTVKAVLYQGVNEVGQEILLDNRGLQRNLEFSNLESLVNYRINIEIIYNLNDGNGNVINNLFYGMNFTTLKAKPSIDVSNVEVDNTSITISARIIDDNSSYETGLIKLYELGKTAPVDMFTFAGTGTKTFVFEGLDPDTEYRVRVDAEIDLDDGEGLFDEIIYDQEFKTHKNIGIDILSITESFNKVTFTADIFNYLSENIYAKLYQGDTLIGTAQSMLAGENEITFDGLLPDTVYNIKVEYSNGESTLWEYQVSTDAIVELTTPTIQITEQSVEGDVLTVKVAVTDPDDTLTSEIVEIRICNEIGLCTVQEININILESGIELPLPYEKNTVEFKMDYDNIKVKGTISDSTEEITVDTVDPVDPTDPTDPVDPTDPEPEPKVGFFQRIWNWIKSLFS